MQQLIRCIQFLEQLGQVRGGCGGERKPLDEAVRGNALTSRDVRTAQLLPERLSPS